MMHRTGGTRGTRVGTQSLVCLVLASLTAPLGAAQHFVTTPFPAETKGETVHFDLSALPKGTPVLRAVLRVPDGGHKTGVGVRLVAVGLPDTEPLKLRPPDYVTFEATAAARAWAAGPKSNQGLRIEERGGVDFQKAVLEVSCLGEAKEPITPVTELKALRQSGQTFLTWHEIEDPVGADAPTFAEFDKAVLDARARRRLVYRVYRHTEPITVANLGQAELAREVPEVVPSWNLKAVRNT